MQIDKMPYEDFKKKYMQGEKYFDFDKFRITCGKCGSTNVEFGGQLQEDDSGCYYPGEMSEIRTKLVCKCRKCGNGFALNIEDKTDASLLFNDKKEGEA